MQRRFRLFKKQYVLPHKRKAHKVKRVHKHPAFFVPAITFGVLLTAGVVVLLIINKGDPTPQLAISNSRVVIVTVNGEERVVPTRANSVGELLRRLNITLHEGDVVEPAKDTEIVSDNFRVNVYRALPVTIVDGDKEIRALSAAATPRSIAKQSGIEAYPEDRLSLDPAQDFVTQGIIGQKLVVKRATPVNVNLYGAPLVARTHAKTVGEFLKEKNIKLGEGETVQPSVESPISPTEPIFVNRKGITVQVATENIAPGTEYMEDATLSFGSRAVRQQGIPGKRIVTYQINSETGERTKLQDIVIQQPVASIVARGTYVDVPSDKQSVMAAAGISRSDFMYVDFIISHESGWRAGATNAGGCGGLGQACPAGKLAAVCPNWQRDPVCQLKFFSGYANRYGGWAGAYNAWQSKGWW
jgi:uncharacterized protein YabE (DUF348 family)